MLKFAFSLALLAAPILIYFFVIRPRLEAKFSETYEHIDGWWARQWARLVAFRTYIIGLVGIYVTELPALIEQLQLVDLSWLPEHWQATLRVAFMLLLIFVRARATTPVAQTGS